MFVDRPNIQNWNNCKEKHVDNLLETPDFIEPVTQTVNFSLNHKFIWTHLNHQAIDQIGIEVVCEWDLSLITWVGLVVRAVSNVVVISYCFRNLNFVRSYYCRADVDWKPIKSRLFYEHPLFEAIRDK